MKKELKKEVLVTESEDKEASGMELKTIDISLIMTSKHNLRTDPGDISALQGSIRKDGMQEPLFVYVTEQGLLCLIDGTRRLAAIKEMGFQSAQCLITKNLTEAQAAHLSYVKNFERKTLSAIEIAQHIKTMKDEFGYTDFELELMGYGSQTSITNKKKLLDLPVKIQTQIHNGILTAAHGQALVKLSKGEEQERMAKRIVDFDMSVKKADAQITHYLSKKRKETTCKKSEIVPSGDVPGVNFKDARDMSELADDSVHLIVTSPPYFIGKEYEIGVTFKEHLENVEAVIKECARVIVPGGIIALNVADIVGFKETTESNNTQIKLMGHFYQNCMKKHKIYLTDEIIWVKRVAWRKISKTGQYYTADTVHTSYPIFNNWEPVYIFRARGERELPSEEIILKSKLTKAEWIDFSDGVWKIEAVRNSEEHPAKFPEELVRRLVKMFSYEGETVLDPFLGSGTTVKVARQVNRLAYGYERELMYKPVIMRMLGLNPDEAVATTMVEYVEQTMPTEEKVVQKIEPKAEFFGRRTQSEETEDDLDDESYKVFSEYEALAALETFG